MKAENTKEVVELLKELGIPASRIKSVAFYWEQVLEDRAFPRIEVEFYEQKINQNS